MKIPLETSMFELMTADLWSKVYVQAMTKPKGAKLPEKFADEAVEAFRERFEGE